MRPVKDRAGYGKQDPFALSTMISVDVQNDICRKLKHHS